MSWLLLGLVAAGTVSAGCASGPETPTGDRGAEKEKRKPQAPHPDELADSPCGNPDWGNLPEEHSIDGDPGSSDQSDDQPDDQEPAEGADEPSPAQPEAPTQEDSDDTPSDE